MTVWPVLLGALPLAVAAWVDGKTHNIPRVCTGAVLACAVANIMWGGMEVHKALFGLVTIGGLLLILSLVDDGQAIGGGDVTLCAALGALVGVINGLALIAVAVVALLIYGVVRHKEAVPFAPFLFPAYTVFLILEMMK